MAIINPRLFFNKLRLNNTVTYDIIVAKLSARINRNRHSACYSQNFKPDFVIDWGKIPLPLIGAASFSTMHNIAYLQQSPQGPDDRTAHRIIY